MSEQPEADEHRPRGPEPGRLKIDEADWKEAARKAVHTSKPPEGWPTYEITLDSKEVMEAVKSLQTELTPELLDLLVHFLEAGHEFCRIEPLPAVGTGELRLALKLTDRANDLLTTIRAVDRDFRVAVDHGSISDQATGESGGEEG